MWLMTRIYAEAREIERDRWDAKKQAYDEMMSGLIDWSEYLEHLRQADQNAEDDYVALNHRNR